MENTVLVSIHDVHCGNYLEVDAFLKEYPSKWLPKVALMIVPCHFSSLPDNYGLTQEFWAQTDFLTWVQEREKLGHEILLHGFYHKTREFVSKQVHVSQSSISRTWVGRWINWFLVGQEAEFAGLPAERMEQEVGHAIQEYQKALGATPMGWVFPTWYGRLPLSFLTQKNVGYTESRWNIYHLKKGESLESGQSVKSLPISWPKSQVGKWLASKVYPLIEPLFQNVRFVLHPGDWSSPRIRSELSQVLSNRKVVRYRELF